jgi:probable addiction module antidote protein
MKKNVLELERFDIADYLDSPEVILAYLDEALETGDAAEIARALGSIARAKGMTDIAQNTGLSRESLYKALSNEGNPELATILKVLRALDLKLVAKAA